jgi:hypothetical protein
LSLDRPQGRLRASIRRRSQSSASGNSNASTSERRQIPALNKAIAEAMTLLKLEDFADKAKSGGALEAPAGLALKSWLQGQGRLHAEHILQFRHESRLLRRPLWAFLFHGFLLFRLLRHVVLDLYL